MFGKDKYLTVSKLHTSGFYHNYSKNYELLNMITPNKMVNMVRTISLARKHVIPSADFLNHN